MLLFLFVGEPLLGLFGVDISSFAIAGSIILLLMGLEMVLGIQLFKHESGGGGAIVPIAFPLIAVLAPLQHSSPYALSIKSQIYCSPFHYI